MPRAQAGDQCSPVEFGYHQLELERQSVGCLRKRRSELSARAKYPWQEAPTRKKVLSSTRLSFSTNLDAALLMQRLFWPFQPILDRSTWYSSRDCTIHVRPLPLTTRLRSGCPRRSLYRYFYPTTPADNPFPM